MWMLFKEGGWWMWFILVFGAIALGTSFAFMMRPSTKHLGFLKWMSRAVLYSIAAGVLMDFSTTLHFVAQDEKLTSDMRARILIEGFGESLAPGVMGFAFLALIAVVTAVGQRRLDAARGA
jgi:hypothetical protein